MGAKIPAQLAVRLFERAETEGVAVTDLLVRFIGEGLDAMDEGDRPATEIVRPYTGTGSSLAGLDPEQASHALQAHKLLGDAFEDATDEQLRQCGWVLDDPLQLVRDRADRLRQAVRELNAAVELAKHQGLSEGEIKASESS